MPVLAVSDRHSSVSEAAKQVPYEHRLEIPEYQAMAGKLKLHKPIDGARLLREVRELGYEGGYTAVTDDLRELRPPG